VKWPYTYDSCDVGTAPNQTLNGEPITAVIDGDHAYGGALSYLPGQRLSRCTCDGEEHPGPKHDDGTYVGRSAPEIDVFEAQVGGHPPIGQVSQSAQWAVSLLFTPDEKFRFTYYNSLSTFITSGTTRRRTRSSTILQ
jgi:beta-glucanase (GH16 family)